MAKAKATYEKLIPNLEFIEKLTKEQRKFFLLKAKLDCLKTFVNFIYSVNYHGIPLSPETVEKLKPFKEKIKKICTKKYSMKQRRQILISEDFFGKLLHAMIPELQEILLEGNN